MKKIIDIIDTTDEPNIIEKIIDNQTTTTMKTEIYNDTIAFNAACCVYDVKPTTVTYEGQEVLGALVRDEDGQVTIMLVCDQAAWDNSEYKNRY